MKELIILLDYVGTFAFAVTGASVAAKSDYDIFGMMFLAFLTAVGGGTVRDIILGLPVFWTISPTSLYIIVGATFLTLFFQIFFKKIRSIIFFWDTLGLGIFAIIGSQKALMMNTNIETAIIMGTITGVLGGILRSVFSNEVPIIFKKEVYATTSAISSVLFISMFKLDISYYVNITVTILSCILIRYASVKFNIHLPKAR
jgi:uncharacterized membrane protein YeiH